MSRSSFPQGRAGATLQDAAAGGEVRVDGAGHFSAAPARAPEGLPCSGLHPAVAAQQAAAAARAPGRRGRSGKGRARSNPWGPRRPESAHPTYVVQQRPYWGPAASGAAMQRPVVPEAQAETYRAAGSFSGARGGGAPFGGGAGAPGAPYQQQPRVQRSSTAPRAYQQHPDDYSAFLDAAAERHMQDAAAASHSQPGAGEKGKGAGEKGKGLLGRLKRAFARKKSADGSSAAAAGAGLDAPPGVKSEVDRAHRGGYLVAYLRSLAEEQGAAGHARAAGEYAMRKRFIQRRVADEILSAAAAASAAPAVSEPLRQTVAARAAVNVSVRPSAPEPPPPKVSLGYSDTDSSSSDSGGEACEAGHMRAAKAARRQIAQALSSDSDSDGVAAAPAISKRSQLPAKAARYAVGGKAAQPTQHGRATDPPRRQPATISLGFSTGAESASDDSDTSLDSELDDIPLASAWELE